MDILYIFITKVSVIGSFWITREVVIELVEEHTGNQLCVLCQRQLAWQFGNLTTHLEDLFQPCRTEIYVHTFSRYLRETGKWQWAALTK